MQIIPDFYLLKKNNVVAAYATAPDILERDKPSMRGEPFLAYCGSGESANKELSDYIKESFSIRPGSSIIPLTIEAKLHDIKMQQNIEYLTQQQLEAMLQLCSGEIWGVGPDNLEIRTLSLKQKGKKKEVLPYAFSDIPEKYYVANVEVKRESIIKPRIPYALDCEQKKQLELKIVSRKYEDYQRLMFILKPIMARRKENMSFFERVLGKLL